MSSTQKLLARAASLARRATAGQRRQAIVKRTTELIRLGQQSQLDTIAVPAKQTFLRFVPHPASWDKTYRSVFSLPPDDKQAGLGAYSTTNRLTGILALTQPGLNGSYWGTSDGAAAEDFHYSCWKDYDPTGLLQLPASTSRVVVQRLKDKLGYGVDSEVPRELVFSGSIRTDIVVARTIRPVRSLNLDLSDSTVQEKLKWLEKSCRPLLDELHYTSIAEGIEDPDVVDFARCFTYGACLLTKPEALWVKSVRSEQALGLDGYDASNAKNFVLLGNGRQSVSDRLVGCGLIQVRSDREGVKLVAQPLHGADSPYADPEPHALMVIPDPRKATPGGTE